ncbi:MAG: hypothetical protein IKE17_14630 [Clostridia bacterium]|nr:hypothetical protein [Clostridia bacterium]
MNPRGECLKELRNQQFILKEHGAKHDKYYSAELNYTVTVKRSNFDEDDKRYILQEIKRERKRQGK